MPVLTIPNIFLRKNLRYYIALPLALMVIGLILSTHLTLDTSLSGGISVIMQTSSQVNTATLASQISSALKVTSPAVFQSPGTVQVTISNNQSIVNAQSYLLNFYAFRSNYTSSNFNATTLQNSYTQNPSNASLQASLSAANRRVNASLVGMNNQLKLELASLSPFIGTMSYNPADQNNMSVVAQNAYTNSTFVYKQKVISTLHSLVPFSSFTYQEITPTLSRFFLSQVQGILIAAFVLISIAVLVIFRSWVPSLAIIFGAGNDIIIALGAMVLLNIPLGLASLGGLLMLIGYAIDTEMITAVRILKRREGTPEERAYSAMKTGLTMTVAAIASFAVLFVVSLVAYVPTYYQISGVVLFGLIGDIITTWFGNAPLILWYKKKHDRG
ncbi:MAG: hypothetical protein KGH53_01925 [Candidatus Micrarchaeota archaeon]|nr:hypothetical protein [Candidatus Micrarchaeota archaeon]